MGDTTVGRGPAGAGIAEDDVAWDRRYLQLEPPAGVHTFTEFGRVDEEVLLSPVAVTEPFRVLSDEGVAVALEIARGLEKIAVGDARSKRMRGCTYRSRFFDGMYRDPALVSFLASLAQADLREHPVGHHRVQLNFAPDELTRDVDVWHYDVVAYDFVMLLTDPAAMKGGNTEFFRGTVDEGMAILAEQGAIPPERIGAVGYPGAGWAFLQQGHQVLHRAARLEEPCPRVSLVASYYCADPRFREPTILPPLRRVDGQDVALVEWAGYAAYRTIERLQAFLALEPDFAAGPEAARRRLAACLVDVTAALEEFDSTDEGFIVGIG
ncbi:MAG TPA: hypothetical protein VKD66_04705 [Streptosporangiaceae bacterium]|nr:hypothetical protein [Streptosporangiaceae bacterium]